MRTRISVKPLAKMLDYILGHRPDEFGLVLDADGYAKLKDLLKVLSEEAGWRHVRESHINELLLTLDDPPVELHEKHIRAVSRENVPRIIAAENPPKLLYTCIRKRAYARALETGITPMGLGKVLLAADSEMAQRIGRRYDPAPILLTVNVSQAAGAGVVFFQAGEALFLADTIPVGAFSGPPLAKEKVEPKKAEREAPDQAQRMPGSFWLDPENIVRPGRTPKRTPYAERSDRDEDRKRGKKEKRRKEPPPWRR